MSKEGVRKMIPNHVKRDFLEINFDDLKAFDLKVNNFYSEIDSLYFMVDCANWEFNSLQLRNKLDELKALDSEEKFFDFVIKPYGLPMYPFCLDCVDRYTLFIADKGVLGTPQIWVQIRSQFLWTYGVHESVRMAIKSVVDLLDTYEISINSIKENRIDFAYHTNYIQDPVNFFREDKLNSMQVSHFKRYSLEGALIGENEIERDYITLGRKKSNNLFFRVYNKTKEVVEMGYKQFFLKLWHDEKLISDYDLYCLQKCFEKSSWEYMPFAKMEYYLEYGIDKNIKFEIKDILEGYPKNYNYNQVLNYCKMLPKVTIICNIEIETKRKFYSTLDKCFNDFEKFTKCESYAVNFYKKIDHLDLIKDFITSDVIRFIKRSDNVEKKRCCNASWWDLLRKSNKKKHSYENVEIYRNYDSVLNLEKMKERTFKAITSLSVCLQGEASLDKDFKQDVSDMMAMFTESDIHRLSKYKNKKFTSEYQNKYIISGILENKRYNLLDLKTGEII